MNPTSFFLVVRPEQINGKLAAHNGQILLHLPNYTEVLADRPEIKDDALQVFEVIPAADEVRNQPESGQPRYLLWKGDQIARSRPQEVVSVEVRSLKPVEPIDPVKAAQAAFGSYPVSLQLAAVAMQAEPADLRAVFGSVDPGAVRSNAEGVLKAAAGGKV